MLGLMTFQSALTLILHLCFQSGFLHSWRLALNQWLCKEVSPTPFPVKTKSSLWVPDKCGHKCSLHSSSPLDLSLDLVGDSPKQGVKVTEKPSVAFQAFSQVLCGWLLAGLQIFQLFDWIYYFFPLLSSLWVDILARWSQAGTDYLASLCSLIVLLIQNSSCRLPALLF